MNLRGFEQDFTKDLESFVKRQKGWEPIIPLKQWSAKKTAAPERHKSLGFESGLSPQTQIHLLDNQNNAFEIIENMLRIYLSPIEYSMSDSFAQIDVEAEQVWLFAMRWLEHYYECLMEPLAIRTEFYKQSHVKFLELMRKMLTYNPKKRITFSDALKFWFPGSSVFSEHQSNEQDSPTTIDPSPLGIQGNPTVEGTQVENLAECHNPLLAVPSALSASLGGTQVMNSAECHNPAHAVAPLNPAPPVESSVSAPCVDPPVAVSSSQSVQPSAQPVVTSARSRLALKRSDGSAGHNKTRRSPRNSGHFPAIGNRGTRVRG
jgi:serine/threonine protein kinase